MSSKLVKAQLNSVLRGVDKQQQGKVTKKGGKQDFAGKRGKRSSKARRQKEAETPEQGQQKAAAVLAANLKYFSKTTATHGKSQDLVAQLLSKQGFQPRPRKQAAVPQQGQQQHPDDEDDDDLAMFGDLM